MGRYSQISGIKTNNPHEITGVFLIAAEISVSRNKAGRTIRHCVFHLVKLYPK